MTWEEFRNLAENSFKKWSEIRTMLALRFNNGSETIILNKSYLVVCAGHSIQIKLEATNPYIGKDDMAKNSGILKDSDSKTKLLRLFTEIETFELQQKNLKRKDPRYPEIVLMIANNKKIMNSLDLDDLILVDDIRIELRFSSVNLDLIQAAKTHPLVDKSKTCMCKACIRVVL